MMYTLKYENIIFKSFFFILSILKKWQSKNNKIKTYI